MTDITTEILEKRLDGFLAPGAYYTSYPTLSEWNTNVTGRDFSEALSAPPLDVKPESTGLYIHFPFCPRLCLYCICNAIVTHDRSEVSKFLHHLEQDFNHVFGLMTSWRKKMRIREIHLGGGSPSYMTIDEIGVMFDLIEKYVDVSDLDEFIVEVDPRTGSQEKLDYYSRRGVNRLSFGIQDLNPEVQKAINRINSRELVESYLTPQNRRKFKSINFDILYGLPLQTKESFAETIDQVIDLSPDRVTLLRYAHVPHIRPHQKVLEKYPMADETEKAEMFLNASRQFKNSGYSHVGIDHFAKAGDELAEAWEKGEVQRTFNGFSPSRIKNIIGFGPSSTFMFRNYYFQNAGALEDYYQEISAGRFPVIHGFRLEKDDLLRREIINSILCRRLVNMKEISEKFDIVFKEYFAYELERLAEFEKEGLLVIEQDRFTITGLGQYFLRHVAKLFDQYCRQKEYEIHGP